MNKLFVFGLCLAFCFVSTLADPIFLLSSGKIEHISNNVFLSQGAFIDTLNKEFLQSGEVPNNIFVFDVKLNDKKFIENPSLILKRLSEFPTIQNRFGASPYVFSSLYVKDALSHGFSEEMLSAIEKSNYHKYQTTLHEFNFENVKNARRNNNKNIVSIIELPISQLAQLDDLFHQSYIAFGQISRNNHLIILKFTDNTPLIPTVLASVKVTERMLQDEDPAAEPAAEEPATTETPEAAAGTPAATTTGDVTPQPIGISPGGFTGFVISIFGIIAIYIGFQIMNGIRSPSRFYKDQLQIGKEH